MCRAVGQQLQIALQDTCHFCLLTDGSHLPLILKVYIVLDTHQEQEIQETQMRITSIPEFYNINIYKCASGRIFCKQLGVNVIFMFYQLTMGNTHVLSSELILSW